MRRRRFHPITAVLFLRRTLVLYLLPLVRVLFARDWAALRAALRQDAALFALLLAVSWVLLHFSRWALDEAGVLHLYWTLGPQLERTVPGGSLAALTLERPGLFRLAGAARVTLYPAGQPARQAVTLCLARRDAETLADALLPAEPQLRHRAAGAERLALAVLGANSLSTLLFLWLAVRESEGFLADAEALALEQVGHLAAFAARWLPMGAAWLLAAAALLTGASFVRSAAQTTRHEAFANGEVLGCRGGLVRRYECRVRRSALCRADIRITPAACLLRQRPVYVTAGGMVSALPLLVFRAGDEALLAAFLPGFVMPPRERAARKGRSIPAYFGAAGGAFGFCLLLTVLALRLLPALALPLFLLALWCLPALGMSAVGYLQEGVWPCGGRLTLRRQRGVTLHCVCVFGPVGLTQRQSPWAVAARRANVTLHFAQGLKETVRSVPLGEAEACFAFLEKE